MTKRKLIPLLLASTMALSLAACGDKSDGKETKSETESTASQPADSSAVSQPDESFGAVSNAEESKAGESAPEQNVTEVPSLKELAKELFGAEELPTEDFKSEFKKALKKDGDVSVCGVLKADSICDPFNDFLEKHRDEIKSKGVDPEAFYISVSEGEMTAVGFYCKDTEEAKEIYSYLYDERSRFERDEKGPVPAVNEKTTDCYAIIKLTEQSWLGYYLVGRAVFAFGSYTSAELDRLCEALNLESPTKL